MSAKKHGIAGISKEVDEERRLCKYAKKYEMIVKQFDEFKGMNTNLTLPVPKCPKRPRARGNASTANIASSSRQSENKEALLQTVTRFLHELIYHSLVAKLEVQNEAVACAPFVRRGRICGSNHENGGRGIFTVAAEFATLHFH
ncbi:hypothetical protein VNO77_17624 [Canavalia gladiata]|uniref:Uncharacterized protein n=1 Tax=Canavalia gladiata TaxID=3824 RepID=A0AAN9LJB5_CANGL